MSLRAPLQRVRGHGSAKEGVEHWWMQRLTAIALVPLTIWIVASLAFLAGASHAEMSAWIAHPGVGIFLVLLIVAVFYHAKLGMQVVIEDYVHAKPVKVTCLIANSFGAIFLAAICIYSVLKIAL